ncbi:5-(carboxyamino)imidazole ribonucleotide mutase [Helicovermis profundi]|uniref:N5-carboxyaminoimidazole ribonucleotide mutase n=1 Tax=Helicovermis profundi TaxID=3065157 RepID=A0AAU9EAV8_9FIRM|nr:5-(carboxyamino)imidazole ribonucleotide mutase [Clostridia bacterium S502]
MKIAIVMGSISDLEVVKKGINILKEFDVDFEVRILSAHRTPIEALNFSKNAENEFDVIIGAAGKAAHLPGVIASHTILPVIGLPIKSSTLDGLDSLLSIVQMPKGIPVATVALNGSENAALLAIQIMSLKYEVLKDKLKIYREKMREDVLKQDKELVYNL